MLYLFHSHVSRLNKHRLAHWSIISFKSDRELPLTNEWCLYCVLSGWIWRNTFHFVENMIKILKSVIAPFIHVQVITKFKILILLFSSPPFNRFSSIHKILIHTLPLSHNIRKKMLCKLPIQRAELKGNSLYQSNGNKEPLSIIKKTH